MPADLLDYQIELDDVLLVDPYLIQVVEGLAKNPELRTSEMVRTHRDGLVKGATFLGGRTITLEMVVVGWDRSGFSQALSQLRALGIGDLVLRFRLPGVAGGNTARCVVSVRNDDIPQAEEYTSFAVEAAYELRAIDPLLYSDAETVLTLTATTVTGGRVYPRVHPFTFGGAGSAGSGNAINIGNHNAPVRIQIHGPITNPRIRNETTGQEIFLAMDLPAGQWVDFDTDARTVLLNGTANRYYYLGVTDWWSLVPGTNNIRFFGTAATGAVATITYRSAWL